MALRYGPWLLLAFVAWLLWNSHNNSIRTTERAEAATAAAVSVANAAQAHADSLESILPGLQVSASYWEAQAAQANSELNATRVTAARSKADAQRREREAAARTTQVDADLGSLLNTLEINAPISLLPVVQMLADQVDSLRVSHASTAQALRDQITSGALLLAGTETALAAEARRGDAQALLNAGLQDALGGRNQELAAVQGVAEVWEARALKAERPGLLAKARAAVVPLAAGIVVGVGVAALVRE